MSHYFRKGSFPRVFINNTSSEQILVCELTNSHFTVKFDPTKSCSFHIFYHKKWQSTKFCRVIFGSKNLNLKVKLGLIEVLLIENQGIWVVSAILIHILFQEAYQCENEPISTNMTKNRTFRPTTALSARMFLL